MEEKEFTIVIEEVLVKEVKVKAKNDYEAMQMVKSMYYSEEIVLSSDDFATTDFFYRS